MGGAGHAGHYGGMRQQEPEDGTGGERRDERVSPPPDAAPEEGAPLRRDREAGLLTGVCAGLGAYTRVDPVVWRTAFALTALAGMTGLWLYLLAWATMRDPRGGPSTVEQFLNRRLAPQTVLALLGAGLAAATALSLVGGISWGTLVLATCLVLGALAARSRGVDLKQTARDLPQWLSADEPAPQAPAPEPEPSYFNPSDPSWSRADRRTPVDLTLVGRRDSRSEAEGDDEDGAAGGTGDERSGWERLLRGDLPHGVGLPHGGAWGGQYLGLAGWKGTGTKRRRRERRGVSLFPFVCFAALAVVAVAFAMSGAFLGSHLAPLYLGSIIVIIGLALTLSAWAGDGRGLVTLGTIVVLVAVAAVTVDGGNVRISNVTWRPDSATEAEEPYRLTAGHARLDLTELALESGDEVAVAAWVGVGSIEVLLPEDARVELRAQITVGEVAVDETIAQSGMRLDVRETLEPSETPPLDDADDEEEAGDDPPVLTVTVEAFGGDVQVQRVAA